MAKALFQAPKGTRDILPPESGRHRAFASRFAAEAEAAGYGQVMSPLFENLGVFLRVGESTEIVSKEMFDFHDKGDPPEHFALRPELTASICRAFAQHRPQVPWKIWYEGPQFRYEAPQAGRYRQFSQVGAEVLGSDDPHVDVEIIAMAWRFYESLGLTRLRLLVNSLGDPAGRPAYVEALGSYLRGRAGELSEQSRLTLERNPLRVLDSKRPEDADVIAGAPLMLDHLSAAAAAHFERVRHGLDRLGIGYELAPTLVRGLDYYTHTAFEFVADALAGAQNAIGGGGRYEGLVEALGGPPTPGIGFALGVDRTLLACDAEGVYAAPDRSVAVFVIDVTGGTEALLLCDELRRAGIGADRAFDGRSMKAQMKGADRSGARYAVIVGEDEVAAGTVSMRDLVSGEQEQIDRAKLVPELEKRLEAP